MKILKSKKSKLFLGIPLALISAQAYFGAIFGYFFSRFLAGEKAGRPGTLKSLAFTVGNWKVHLHHWFLSLAILLSAMIFDFYIPLHRFMVAFAGGVIFQGIFDYNDWYKIFTRKKKN